MSKSERRKYFHLFSHILYVNHFKDFAVAVLFFQVAFLLLG